MGGGGFYMLKLLRNIYLPCVRKQRVLIILCGFGLMISTALVSIIQMVSVGRESYASSYGRELNHGDLAVGFVSDREKNLYRINTK